MLMCWKFAILWNWDHAYEKLLLILGCKKKSSLKSNDHEEREADHTMDGWDLWLLLTMLILLCLPSNIMAGIYVAITHCACCVAIAKTNLCVQTSLLSKVNKATNSTPNSSITHNVVATHAHLTSTNYR
jgi:hypothetical protein